MVSHIREITGLLPHSVRFGLRQVIFSGSTAQCPLCLNGIRKWASHGGGPKILEKRKVVGGMLRENDRCPICHGADRTRLMMHWFKKRSGIGIKPLKILHIAPDYGLYLWLSRCNQVNYTGCDLDKSRYRHIENMFDASLTNLPFADNHFDIVICTHVLEHVIDDVTAINNIYRVVKPGGCALLLVPEATDGGAPDENPNIVAPEERNEHFGQWDHVRLYTPELFNERLESAGFTVEIFNGFKEFPDEARYLHLNELENLRVAKKSTIN